MAIANIISAIGNNSSVYPLLVRDCGIENPTKVFLTYNQNKKESKKVAYLATRERAIDEYATSAVWLGGIPVVGYFCDKFIKSKGLNPNINLKLFKEDAFQGIDYNIKKFAQSAPEAVQDLIKAKDNKKLLQKLTASKFIVSTSIPILFMGFILPKMIFKSSENKVKKLKEQEKTLLKNDYVQKDKFFSKNPSFKGNWVAKVANFSAQDKMAVTDCGYAIGRISTARNKNETIDIAFKMAGMMFLNFVAPKWIEKGLNKITGIELDPVILADKKFAEQIKQNNFDLPKSADAKDLFAFIDNISNKDTLFIKYAKKFSDLKMLENGVRDPRAYVDVKKLAKLTDDLNNFVSRAKGLSEADLKLFIKKAKMSKYTNILTNVVLSSFLLAYGLPKVQYAFRQVVTKSPLEPGLAENA